MSRVRFLGKCFMGWGLALTLACGCASAQRTNGEQNVKTPSDGGTASWRFDRDIPGRVPSNWSIHETNPTQSLATWKVLLDAGAPSRRQVMALTRSENYNGTYNLAIAQGRSFRDLELSVKVKAVAGKEDQGGGPIWRCRDENHYYICRFNPLEGNYRVYVVSGGKRRQLESANMPLDVGRWYTLRIEMVGESITCYLDGKKMLEATDNTLTETGQVGLWTKADAVTSFDDLEVKAKGK